LSGHFGVRWHDTALAGRGARKRLEIRATIPRPVLRERGGVRAYISIRPRFASSGSTDHVRTTHASQSSRTPKSPRARPDVHGYRLALSPLPCDNPRPHGVTHDPRPTHSFRTRPEPHDLDHPGRRLGASDRRGVRRATLNFQIANAVRSHAQVRNTKDDYLQYRSKPHFQRVVINGRRRCSEDGADVLVPDYRDSKAPIWNLRSRGCGV
jgi:hypothetical protein